MARYLVRRVINLLPVLLFATIISFTIMHLAPGGPENMIIGGEGDATVDTAKVEQLRHAWGLDQPIYVQYLVWLKNVGTGNFGYSYFQSRPVSQIVGEALPNTLEMNAVVLVLIYLISLPLGILSAVRQYSKFDYAVTGMAFLGMAAPAFWVAMMLQVLVVKYGHGLLPTNGMSTPDINLNTYGWLSVLADRAKYLLLPVIVATFHGLTGMTRYMRSSMLEVLKEDYIRTARAKGMHQKVVIYKHAMRNAILPIVTLSGGLLASLVSGSVILEVIFSWPGLGRVGFNAVNQRDYPVSMAILVMGMVLLLLGYLIVDIAYVFVDPRIKYD